MLRFLKARVLDWLLFALAFAIGAVVLPATLSDAPAEDLVGSSVKIVPLFIGVFIIGDLTLRISVFIVSSIAMKYFGETIRKHLRNYGIGIERPESGT
ncbi:MAG: hypothetical protein KF886_09315 [Candidatus Hydrogenedentes bacterium]|nr:hypothetical protein [Candidatus Hydrogenedentota bacterium]